MTEYNKRGGSGSYGARSEKKPSFGGSRSGVPSFGKKNWAPGRSSNAPVTFYKAACSECRKVCEVPFRPTGTKPVYCKDCFNVAGGSFNKDKGGDRFPKKDFSARPAYAPRAESGSNNDAVLKQLEAINTKLDQIMREVAALS